MGNQGSHHGIGRNAAGMQVDMGFGGAVDGDEEHKGKRMVGWIVRKEKRGMERGARGGGGDLCKIGIEGFEMSPSVAFGRNCSCKKWIRIGMGDRRGDMGSETRSKLETRRKLGRGFNEMGGELVGT